MRINKYVASVTGLSRRRADDLISGGHVYIYDKKALLGDTVEPSDHVYLDKKQLKLIKSTTLMLNKPVGYVCSRNGQGSKTIYDLLPEDYRTLKPVGRLDKDSTGLILLTSDGDLANKLTHPKYVKNKLYRIKLDKRISSVDIHKIETGVSLDDGLSKFKVSATKGTDNLLIELSEGRNRQIRRTFKVIGYKVVSLHREIMGEYSLGNLSPGKFKVIQDKS